MLQLESLVLEFNRITSVPEELVKLPNLRNLILFSNEIDELPEEIGDFDRLFFFFFLC